MRARSTVVCAVAIRTVALDEAARGDRAELLVGQAIHIHSGERLARASSRDACLIQTPSVPGLQRLLMSLDRDDHVRGRQWERICRWYLDNDPVYKSQIRRAWLWKSWPGRWGADAGIDLVAELRDGSLMAVQAKAYSENYFVTKADVDSFLSESSRPKFSRRLIIATTNHIGRTALRTVHAQAVPAKFLALGELEGAEVDWPASPDDLLLVLEGLASVLSRKEIRVAFHG